MVVMDKNANYKIILYNSKKIARERVHVTHMSYMWVNFKSWSTIQDFHRIWWIGVL